MQVKAQTKLIFHGVDILDISFNSIALKKEAMKIDFKCLPKVFYLSENNKFFRIIMEIELNDKRYFELKLTAVGLFEMNNDVKSEMSKSFVNINAPAIMFPYVRAFISTLTANMGNTIGTLTIPTQFFKGVLEEVK